MSDRESRPGDIAKKGCDLACIGCAVVFVLVIGIIMLVVWWVFGGTSQPPPPPL
jgi:hypothetical protein